MTLPGRSRYVRHRPEDSVLYGVVEEHLESFYRTLAEQGTTLPAFVHASASNATCAAGGSSTDSCG